MGNARVARDYYGILGVGTRRRARRDQAGVPQARPRAAPRRQPGRGGAGALRRGQRRVRGAVRPGEAPDRRPRRRPAGQRRRRGRRRGDPFSAFGLGDIMDAFFGGGAAGGRGRGPRSRVQPGADALIRMQLTLEECATGVTRDLAVDTAVVCPECTGSGAAPGSGTAMCDICAGRGEVQSVQRSFLGQVVTSRPCPNCRGFGEVIPDPCRQCGGDGRVRSRRTVGVRIPAGRGRRHAGPAGPPGRGRARAAARPATCTSRSTRSRTTSSPATAPTCTAPSSCR